MKIYLSLFFAKLTYSLIKLSKFGAGFTWPGHVALKVAPNLLTHKSNKFKNGIILISGTNGKTTTSTLLTNVLESSGLKVLHNSTGANLLNGIASAIILDKNLDLTQKSDVAVFEVDEFTLHKALKKLKANYVILLNLSRDQLDRYGETDLILERWNEIFSDLDYSPTVVLDSTQQFFDPLKKTFQEQNIKILTFDADSKDLDKTKLYGIFNAKNVNAVVKVALDLHIDKAAINTGLQSFDPAFGRGEVINYYGKPFQIFLAKNPASFNNNLTLFASNSLEKVNTEDHHTLESSVEFNVDENSHKFVDCDGLLFVLNDEVRDGKDISWIYDINPTMLQNACQNKTIYVGGTRCFEMAARLQYAGIQILEDHVSLNLKELLDTIAEDHHISKTIVFPNYSAMLWSRKLLLGREIL